MQNGCLSFLPGTQHVENVEAINLGEPQDIFNLDPALKNVRPVPCELKAGSATFHHGMTFHYAGANKTEGMREAFAIIYMPSDTTFNGNGPIVTEDQGFEVGAVLDLVVAP